VVGSLQISDSTLKVIGQQFTVRLHFYRNTQKIISMFSFSVTLTIDLLKSKFLYQLIVTAVIIVLNMNILRFSSSDKKQKADRLQCTVNKSRP